MGDIFGKTICFLTTVAAANACLTISRVGIFQCQRDPSQYLLELSFVLRIMKVTVMMMTMMKVEENDILSP